MVRLSQYEESEREHLLKLPCPTYTSSPYVAGLKVSQSRIALISTAGLHRRADRPFGVGETGYRLIPKDVEAKDLVMSHISTNFDRTGFQMDLNMVFPLDRLRELEQQGFIGSLSEFHYSFMGATPPEQMEQEALQLAAILKKDQVDAVLLVPV
ncbi:MAG: glycine/betaine/sarcosine/D-proline family reductase selenoprotein B [Proteobacteria bacterium]|nr:glycine/betaine/sarcosine/D-proline family reductase selenoprotein B [Pseudomonadota bacterium]